MTTITEIKKRLEAASSGLDENWKPVPGYEGIYEASDFGRVKSYKLKGNNSTELAKNPRILGTGEVKGRDTVTLCKRGLKPKRILLSRIIMLAFNGPCPEGMEVAHLDGNYKNNILSNLKYCTHKQNESHKLAHGTHPRGENNGRAIFSNEQAFTIKFLLQQGFSTGEVGKLFKVHYKTICNLQKSYKDIPSVSYTDIAFLLEKINKIINYSKFHTEQMWAATIIAIILDCDFRDAKSELKEVFGDDET